MLDRSQLLLETLRALRVVEVLEHIATPDARQVLEYLAKGTTTALLKREARAALARLGARETFGDKAF